MRTSGGKWIQQEHLSRDSGEIWILKCLVFMLEALLFWNLWRGFFLSSEVTVLLLKAAYKKPERSHLKSILKLPYSTDISFPHLALDSSAIALELNLQHYEALKCYALWLAVPHLRHIKRRMLIHALFLVIAHCLHWDFDQNCCFNIPSRDRQTEREWLNL